MNAGPRILVVDDDPDAVDLLETLLVQEGYVVSKAADGDGALQAFESELFDLVISDVRMPGKHGFNLLSAVRSSRRDIPVILVTGYPNQDALLNSIGEGAYAYVEKPFDNSYLLSLVRMALASRADPAGAS